MGLTVQVKGAGLGASWVSMMNEASVEWLINETVKTKAMKKKENKKRERDDMDAGEEATEEGFELAGPVE